MDNLNTKYINLIKEILEEGQLGIDIKNPHLKGIFSKQLQHNMSEGFPLLTTSPSLNIKEISVLLKWFLKGDDNIEFLHNNSCHIFDEYLYSFYEEIHNPYIGSTKSFNPDTLNQEEFFEKMKIDPEFRDIWKYVGPIQGIQWKKWEHQNPEFKPLDQIALLIYQIKECAENSKLIVNSYDPNLKGKSVLTPLTLFFQCCVINGKISLSFVQRSSNILKDFPQYFSLYGLLLKLIAQETNLIPDKLLGTFNNLYIDPKNSNRVNEIISAPQLPLPSLELVNYKKGDIFKSNFDYKISFK